MQDKATAQLSGPKPTILASSVQAVVACNATAPRVCTLVLFINLTSSVQYPNMYTATDLFLCTCVILVLCMCCAHAAYMPMRLAGYQKGTTRLAIKKP